MHLIESCPTGIPAHRHSHPYRAPLLSYFVAVYPIVIGILGLVGDIHLR
jgi:hypothetical protein